MRKQGDELTEQVRKYLAARLTKQGKELRDLRLAVEHVAISNNLLGEIGDIDFRLVTVMERLATHMERPWWERLMGYRK